MKRSTVCKTIAMILSVLLLCSTVLFASATAFLFWAGGYTGGYAQTAEELQSEVLRVYAWDVWRQTRDGQAISKQFTENNFYYTVDVNGVRDRRSNFNGQPFAHMVTVQARADDLIKVTLYEKAVHTHTDLLSLTPDFLNTCYSLRYAAPIIAVSSLLLWVLTVIFLFSAAGHRKREAVPILNRIDRIPFDLYTAICAAISIGIGSIGLRLTDIVMYTRYYSARETAFVWIVSGAGILACAIALYLILLGYLLSFATRVKVGGLLRRTVCARILRFAWRVIRTVFRSLWRLVRSIPLLWKTWLILIGISLIELILLLCNLWEGDNILGLWLTEKVLLFPVILYAAMMLRTLKKGGERIAEGNFTEKINTQYMPADFGDFGQTLNHIGDGLSRAVEEQLKSERMKTELITNVSHDIKTPLTSIVNYVDLIKKEPCENETVCEYIEVLDRQSARLKKLIEDLVEASKASSGALTVQMERCELGVLLEQSLGEYEARLAECLLTPVATVPEEPITVLADGRRLWRVFDNLLSNVCKYALPNTRVYITLERQEKRAVITVRNISRDPLNITSDELMERFVRGDAARHTEGSGLGLSIARSLVELQGGSLSLSIDGDLFKATVEFDTVE